MPSATAFEKLMEQATAFVKKQKGTWEHPEWEAFLGKADKLGIELNDENKRQIGNLLEAQKELYFVTPQSARKPAAKKKSAAKKKTAAKRKPAARR